MSLKQFLNQTIDFIFYNNKKKVFLIENSNVTGDATKKKYTLPGTFAEKGHIGIDEINKNNKVELLTVEDAKKALATMTKKIKIKTDIDGLNLTDHGLYVVQGDKRTLSPEKEGICKIIITQVFAVQVSDDDISGEGIWMDKNQTNEQMFFGHKIILNNLEKKLEAETYGFPDEGTIEEGSYGGGRRTRKRRGKKSKKSKKTHKRRHH